MAQLRVLQVIGAMNRAGAETVLMNLYRAMDRERIQFDFLVHTAQRCDYDDEIEALGGRIFRIPSYRIINGPAYRRIVRGLLAQHPEWPVVHGHIGSCSAIYLDEAKRAGRATVVHSHGENGPSFIRSTLYKALTRPATKYADEFLACSLQSGIDRYGASVVEGEHFEIMPNGIDVNAYACTDEQHQAAQARLGLTGGPIIGHVGRLVPGKNHAFLLHVYAELLKELPEAQLLALGRGPEEENLRQQAAELGLDPDSIFVGVKDEVPCYLQAMDAFVFPSLHEGLPMALVEAQAAGLPCFIADTITETAVIGDTSQRLSLEDGPTAWAQAIARQLATPADRSAGAQAVRGRGYDIHDVAHHIGELYLCLAASRQTARTQS